MANSIFATINYVRNTLFNPVVSGGAWDSQQSLEKLLNSNLLDVAVSQGDSVNNTKFDVDLGVLRAARIFAIPDNVRSFNPSLDARHRIRATRDPKWNGIQVAANVTSGSTILPVKEVLGSAQVIDDGDTFSVRTFLPTGEPVWATYKVVTGASLSALGSASITISESFAYNHENNDRVDCNVGDFTNPELVIDWEDIFSIIYPYGSLPWWNSSVFTGKPSEDDRLTLPFPVIKTFRAIVARYWRYEIDDEGNRPWDQANLQLPYLFIGNGYQPSVNPSYQGTSLDFITESNVDRTIGGRRIVGVEPTARKFVASFQSIGKNESFLQAFDTQWLNSLDDEMLFIFDPDDTKLMHRRAFLATLEKKRPITFPFFNHNDFNIEIVEVL